MCADHIAAVGDHDLQYGGGPVEAEDKIIILTSHQIRIAVDFKSTVRMGIDPLGRFLDLFEVFRRDNALIKRKEHFEMRRAA